REEDSLYFRHFLKFVYKNTTKIMVVWIKLRKLKLNGKLLKKNANCHIIIQLIKTDGLPNSFGTNISRGIMERNVNIINDVNGN
ncbi:MAG: hypothetical protein NC428_03135, partial [Clostridium sp.]|nr:hypothetical protein [Clostridium sp.]